MTPSMNLTLEGITPEQCAAVLKLIKDSDSKKSKPPKTVSDDEDEDFGKKPLKAKDLEDDEDDVDTATDEDSDDEEDADEDADDNPQVTFKELRAAVNKYGEKKPDQMRAILLGFNMKSPKELSAKGAERYWDAVYAKVNAKLKALKKK